MVASDGTVDANDSQSKQNTPLLGSPPNRPITMASTPSPTKKSSESTTKDNDVAALKSMLLDTKVDGNKSFWTATLETFGMADGKTHKDDIIIVSNGGGGDDDDDDGGVGETRQALELMRTYASSKTKDEYVWELVPMEPFGATRDDVFLAFLKWAEKDVPTSSSSSAGGAGAGAGASGGGADGGGSKNGFLKMKSTSTTSSATSTTTSTCGDTKTTTRINVSKAVRRMDAYFGWMKDNRGDLEDRSLMTWEAIKDAAELWDIQITYDARGKFLWWIDLGKLDARKVKELSTSDHLRYVVWFAHLVMFDRNARDNGAVIIEDLAHIGFWKLATLIPSDLSAKMDRLTIGILPVKMKAIYVFGAAGWMHLLMKLMKPFMGKKMRDRMVLVSDKTDMQTFCDELVDGDRSKIPTGFCQLQGDAPRDAVLEKFM